LTKVWPHADYPLVDVGVMELNRNVENYFAETEQAAFSPGNMVPGTGASPDRVLQARLFSYPDAQRYRVGVNYNQLAVNCPHATQANHYQRAGAMAGASCPFDHGKTEGGSAAVHYGPNSKGGPAQAPEMREPPLRIDGDADRFDHQDGNDNYTQAGDLFRIMSDDQKQQLAANIAGGLKQCSTPVQERMLPHFDACDADYGKRVREAMKA